MGKTAEYTPLMGFTVAEIERVVLRGYLMDVYYKEGGRGPEKCSVFRIGTEKYKRCLKQVIRYVTDVCITNFSCIFTFKEHRTSVDDVDVYLAANAPMNFDVWIYEIWDLLELQKKEIAKAYRRLK